MIQDGRKGDGGARAVRSIHQHLFHEALLSIAHLPRTVKHLFECLLRARSEVVTWPMLNCNGIRPSALGVPRGGDSLQPQ